MLVLGVVDHATMGRKAINVLFVVLCEVCQLTLPRLLAWRKNMYE